MDPALADAFFVAFSPRARLAFGYVWRTADFPWMGIWEENHSRTQPPWNGGTLTRGMEFGVSPMPESRRAMIDRGRLFGVPTYRWIPARTRVAVEYWIHCHPARPCRNSSCARASACPAARRARWWKLARSASVRLRRPDQPQHDSRACFQPSAHFVSIFEIEDLRHDTILSRSTPGPEPARRDDAGQPHSSLPRRRLRPPRPPARPPPAPGRSHITGGDDMKFSVTEITAKPGETIHIQLKNVGTIPKMAMAHNVVVLKPTTKVVEFNTAAASGPRHGFHSRGDESGGRRVHATRRSGRDRRNARSKCRRRQAAIPSCARSPGTSPPG